MTYKEARVYLDEMSKYGSVLGLNAIRALLRRLGNPQDSLRFVHIAGTNGKGSVLAYTSTILSEAGYRTGRYVSPAVVSYLERIQIDEEWISEEEFAEKTEQVRDAIAQMEQAGEPAPTVFETETAIAFLYFKEKKCDFVVLEAGLGGALDATNIVTTTECAVFTPISRDHLGVIGNTIEEIAQNKSGIIKPGCTVVSAEQPKEADRVLRDRAREEGCPFFVVGQERIEVIRESYRGFSFRTEGEEYTSRLAGKVQQANVATVLQAVSALRGRGYAISMEAVRRGFERTRWPGRLTCIMDKPVFLLDGAHNEAAAESLRQSLEEYFPNQRKIFLMGVFRDKEYDRICRIMCPLAETAYTFSLPDSGRTLSGEELAAEAGKWCSDVRACSSWREAVESALLQAKAEDVIVAFGSLSCLGAIWRLVRPEQLPAEP